MTEAAPKRVLLVAACALLDADNRVLLYPIAGLGTAGIVGAFAIGVHKLSGPDTLAAPTPRKPSQD